MSYRVTWEQDAVEALDKLDATIVHRIFIRISWLAINIENIKPQALARRLRGYYKLRTGNYRIIYSINHSDKEIVIEYIGHRRDIYNIS